MIEEHESKRFNSESEQTKGLRNSHREIKSLQARAINRKSESKWARFNQEWASVSLRNSQTEIKSLWARAINRFMIEEHESKRFNSESEQTKGLRNSHREIKSLQARAINRKSESKWARFNQEWASVSLRNSQTEIKSLWARAINRSRLRSASRKI